MTPLNVNFRSLDWGLFLALYVAMVCVTGARISNPWYKSEKFPSLTDNCCSHQSFTLIEDTYDAIIVIFFWPLVSLLMLLGYVTCRGFLVVRSITKRSKINSQRERHVTNGNNDVDKADSLVANLKSTHDWFMKLSGKKKIRIYFGVSISFRKYFSLLVISNRSRLRILFL